MNMELHPFRRELDPLTDSLASRVRWRVSDYEAIVRAELELMLENGDPAVSLAKESKALHDRRPRP